jgi:trk system potassium uptake protein
MAGIKHLVGNSVLRFLRFRQLFSTIRIIFTLCTAIVTLLIFIYGHINILDLISSLFTTFTTGRFVFTSTALDLDNPFILVVLMTGMINRI